MRLRLILTAILLASATTAATETLTIEPTTPGWWTDPQPLALGGPLPLAAVARIGCPGFVAGPEPSFVVEHAPQVQMPVGFIEFRLTSREPGIEPTIAVQMPNGAFLCGTAGGPSVRAGALPGTYLIWAASRIPSNTPVEGLLEISHVPLPQRR